MKLFPLPNIESTKPFWKLIILFSISGLYVVVPLVEFFHMYLTDVMCSLGSHLMVNVVAGVQRKLDMLKPVRCRKLLLLLF